MNTFTSFDGVRIAYHDEGEGPAVILLHGFGLDGMGQFGDFERILPLARRRQEMFRQMAGAAPPLPDPPPEGRAGLVRALQTAGARTIIPDMRGFGASDKPRDKAAYEDSAMSRDVVALIEHLHLDAVDVIGFSMGCGTAARLLALRPPQVKSAILAGVGDYALEDGVLEFPKSWPVPDCVPRPITRRVSTEEGARQNWPAEALAIVDVPVLVLNGRADAANQKVDGLLGAIPTARSAACEGDHHSTPYQPSGPCPAMAGRSSIYGFGHLRPTNCAIINIDGSGMRRVLVKAKVSWINLWDLVAGRQERGCGCCGPQRIGQNGGPRLAHKHVFLGLSEMSLVNSAGSARFLSA